MLPLGSSSIRLLKKTIVLSINKNKSDDNNSTLFDTNHRIVIDPVSLTPLKFTQSTDDFFIIERVATPDEYSATDINIANPNFDIKVFIQSDLSRFSLSNPNLEHHDQYLEPIKSGTENLGSAWTGSIGSYVAIYDLINSLDYVVYPQLSIEDKASIKKIIIGCKREITDNAKASKLMLWEQSDVNNAIDDMLNNSHGDTDKTISRICFVLNLIDKTEQSNKVQAILNRHISEWLLDSIDKDKGIVSELIEQVISPILLKNAHLK